MDLQIGPKVCFSIEKIPGRGLGVIAREPIPAGTWIERAPVLVLPDEETAPIEATRLRDYYFGWGEGDHSELAIGFGYVALYNHGGARANAEHRKLLDQGFIDIVATRDIAVGDEILITYASVWFDPV